MSKERAVTFTLDFESLPSVIPVFPLPNAIVLPHAVLPLNIFEPRYLAMIEDSLAEPLRLIGMVQTDASGELYSVGCAGRVTTFQETDDGRYLINLSGVCRFHTGTEAVGAKGYRRFNIDWTAFRDDVGASTQTLEVQRLRDALREYATQRQLSLSWSAIDGLGGEELVNTLTQGLPFEVEQKQALLEASSLDERAKLLTVMLDGTPSAGTVLH